MPDAFASSPAALPPSFLPVLLELLPNGVIYYLPVTDATDTVVDFHFAYLNPAAQRLLALPERPAATYLTQWPEAMASGAFAFLRDAWLADAPAQHDELRLAEGTDPAIRAQARRLEAGLLLTFTVADSEVEAALRASQAREQAARAEAERQRSELQRVFELAPVAIAVYRGPQHIIELANATTFSLWGRPNQQGLGQPLLDVLPELTGQGFEELLDQVRTTGVPYRGHDLPSQILRNGQVETVYWDFVYLPMYEADGSTYGVLTVAADVTEQVQARRLLEEKERLTNLLYEEIVANNHALEQTQNELRRFNEELEARVAERTTQLAEQQGLLHQILGQVPAAVVTLSGPDHRFTFFNTYYQQLVLGQAQLGRPVAEALPPLAQEGSLSVLDHVYATGQPYVAQEVATTLAQRKGPPIQQYFDFTYQPLTDGQGQRQGILGFAVNVTEQVQAKQQREAQQQQLQDLFAQAPVAICVYRGPEYLLELVNPRMANMLGYPVTQLLGQRFFEAIPELASQGLREVLDEVRRTGVPFVAQSRPVRLAHHRPGQTGYFDFVYQPLRRSLGDAAVVCVATEVTEQVLARERVQDLNEELSVINEELQATNEELNETNNRLTRTNADLDTFVYSASHDLKSPITNIEGLLVALREHLPPTALQANLVPQLLGMMDGAVQRFQQTLGHLTDVSRLQQDTFDQPAEAVNLPALVEDVRLDILPELSAAGATLTLELGECPTIYFPVRNLRSILYNLLSNAVKYRALDRPALVLLRCRPTEAGHMVLEVQDNGLGLSEQQQSKLFSLFRRLHTHVSGSGVGLYMVKKMVDNAGGTLTVRSQPDVGSTFTVTLPSMRPAGT